MFRHQLSPPINQWVLELSLQPGALIDWIQVTRGKGSRAGTAAAAAAQGTTKRREAVLGPCMPRLAALSLRGWVWGCSIGWLPARRKSCQQLGPGSHDGAAPASDSLGIFAQSQHSPIVEGFVTRASARLDKLGRAASILSRVTSLRLSLSP